MTPNLTPQSIHKTYVSKISGIGSAFPEHRRTNLELSQMVETNDEWIRERTGISERRISKRGLESEFNSSLGCRSSLKALEMAGKRPEDVQAIFYATCTPDTLIPSTGCWLQHKLGAHKAFAVDLNAACSGFVYGLSMADAQIRTGMIENALVIGTDVTSAFVDWEDRQSCILFGDGSGAAFVERAPENSTSRIYSTHLQSSGDDWEVFYMPAGGSAMEVTEEARAKKFDKMHMRGKEIFKVAVKTLADFAVKAIESNGFKLSDVDWVIPHQANMRIIEAVAKRLDLPMEKVLINIDRYGNTSAATVPTALDEAVRDGRVQRGQLLLMDVFGAGLTYGSALLRW